MPASRRSILRRHNVGTQVHIDALCIPMLASDSSKPKAQVQVQPSVLLCACIHNLRSWHNWASCNGSTVVLSRRTTYAFTASWDFPYVCWLCLQYSCEGDGECRKNGLGPAQVRHLSICLPRCFAGCLLMAHEILHSPPLLCLLCCTH